MKNKKLNRNIYIIGTILIIFTVGYYLYLEVYTKSKEEKIIATKSRILEQMSQNLQAKVKSMKTNAAEYAGYLLTMYNVDKNATKDNFHSWLVQRKYLAYFNTNLEYVNPGNTENISKNDTVIGVSLNVNSDFVYFHVGVGRKSNRKEQDTIKFRVKYDVLMKELKQRNIFNDFILIINETSLFSTLQGKPNLIFTEQEEKKSPGTEIGSEKEPANGSIDISIQSKDARNNITVQSKIRGVQTYDISLSSTQYKLFVCQTQVEDQPWNICGLVKAEQIDQAKKEMAPLVLIIVFLVLALIILGLPFIKLKVMSSTEHLTPGNLINTAISIFLGVSFIFLFIFFASNAHWYRNQIESRLNNLAKEINNSLTLEIINAWDQLNIYDKIGFVRKKQGKDLPESIDILMNDKFKPINYQYFDYAFWMDATGMQKATLTPFSAADNPSNLSTRNYFKNPNDWMLPLNNSRRFRMESIVSVTSGDAKVALSKKADIEKMVIAMTGRFYSIIEPILPKYYKFCIIDGDGLVWFHSDKLRNLQENFIRECNQNKSLTAAIYANTTTTLDVTYYDEFYRVHIESLYPMPLYLVTMFDKHAEHSNQVQFLMLTLLLFSALAFFITFQSVILFFFKRFIGKSGWKNLILDFIGAKEDHHKIYLVMSIILVLIAIIYLLLIDSINFLVPLLSALAMSSILFPYLNYAINEFSLRASSNNLFAIVNGGLFILINILAWNLMSEWDFYKMLIFQGAIIVLLAVGFIVLKRDFILKSNTSNITYYVGFLMGLLLVYSVTPSIKFFEASVNHEIIRRVKHDQLELSRLRETRNERIGKYYMLMEKNLSAKNSFEQRLEQGVYSEYIDSKFYIKGKASWEKMHADFNTFFKNNKVIDNNGEFLINKFRPVYDRTSIETKYLDYDNLLNGKQKWTLYDTTLVFDYFSTTEKYMSIEPDSCRIITNIQRPEIFSLLTTDKSAKKSSFFQKYDIIFILLLIFVLYGIYHLILFATRSLFGISILEMHTEYNFGKHICDRIASAQSVMVVGSSFVNPADHIKNLLKINYNLATLEDVVKSDKKIANESLTSKKNVLVIKNFASDYYSPESLAKQMNKINEKIRQNEKMVIISLTTPLFIKNYLEQQVRTNGNKKEKTNEKPDEITESWEQLLNSFNNILANVDIIHTPEKYNPGITQPGCHTSSKCSRILFDYKGTYDENLKCFI